MQHNLVCRRYKNQIMDALQKYGSGSSSSDDSDDEETAVAKLKEVNAAKNDDSTLHLKPPPINTNDVASVASQIAIHAAPTVAINEKMDLRRHIDPCSKEVKYNPKYEELFAPVAGPIHPFKTQQEAAVKNTLSGFVEPSHLNEFQFEVQRRTFHSYGFAQDPSNKDDTSAETDDLIGKRFFL